MRSICRSETRGRPCTSARTKTRRIAGSSRSISTTRHRRRGRRSSPSARRRSKTSLSSADASWRSISWTCRAACCSSASTGRRKARWPCRGQEPWASSAAVRMRRISGTASVRRSCRRRCMSSIPCRRKAKDSTSRRRLLTPASSKRRPCSPRRRTAHASRSS